MKKTPILILVLFALGGSALFFSGCNSGGAPTADSVAAVLAAYDPVQDEDRFVKEVFVENLHEPMEIDLLDDGRILFIERHGTIKILDPVSKVTEVIAELEVFSKLEEGLLGVAVDPNYVENRWVYFNYSHPVEPELRVARFVLEGSTLDRNSEKVLLKIPVQREECCHVGGSLEFDAQGNLYISVGDNTNPFASDGFGPIDEREGRSPWNAQVTSGNTDDLRGKILRIKPEPDGTYSIPEGNLFPRDGSSGRPEIYVMGNRNPFRIAIDKRTGFLYWGEVGPDAGEDDPNRGPKGHDEVNQARQAGNFGWPYFVGDNKPYHDYDFATAMSGPSFDPTQPVNDAPENTGERLLPPAQPAFIWYPYGPSELFPLLGEGGRNAMAGPVFYYDDYEASERKFPPYYDGKLITYDWMRGWMMAVTMNEAGDFVSMERFLPSTRFNNPMDMLFGPDGVMYVLEYGTTWNRQNPDARISRISFYPYNRAPVAQIAAEHAIGAAPLTVSLSATASYDPDDDPLRYAWSSMEGLVESSDAEVSFTVDQPGTYDVLLTVTDAEGGATTEVQRILVGNDIPEVVIEVEGNRSFFWEGGSFDYRVSVSDTEDGRLGEGGIEAEEVILTIDYLARSDRLRLPAQGHLAAMEASSALVGKALLDGSDCFACHQADAASIGPSYKAIAEKYRDEEEAPAYLVDKIIKGGGGVWGDQAMAAHPQLAPDEVAQIVDYILSMGVGPVSNAPLAGTYLTTPQDKKEGQGQYIITATYTDRGGASVGPLTGRDVVTLRHARVQAEAFEEAEAIEVFPAPEDVPGTEGPAEVAGGGHNASLTFRNIDMTGVSALTALVSIVPDTDAQGHIDVYVGRASGEKIGTFAVTASSAGFEPLSFTIAPRSDVVDLVFVFVGEGQQPAGGPLFGIDWIYFDHNVE